MQHLKLGIIGVGNMGSAFIKACISGGMAPDHIYGVVHSDHSRQSIHDIGIQAIDAIDDVLGVLDFVVVAVKPKDVTSVCTSLKNKIPSSATVISIVAGVSITTLSELLCHERIVRCMPNTPISIGMGVCGWFAAEAVENNIVGQLDSLFKLSAKNIWLEQEDQLHAITALYGSGPAYFYYFAEVMEELSREMGLPENSSQGLICQMFLGAASLALAGTDTFTALRRQVTSPKGTTESAIKNLEKEGVAESFKGSLKLALKRSIALQNTTKV